MTQMTAFEGVKVLDCAQDLAGSMAAMLFADFGAEVLKVERTVGARRKEPPWYVGANRNKHRVAFDWTVERTRFGDLLAAADLVIFDVGPSRMREYDCEAASLMSRHPLLTHLWVPPYGTTGRWSDLPAHHATLTGLTGTAFRQGSYADQPVWHEMPLVHYAQAVIAASAAAAALFERTRTGRGHAATVTGLHAMAEMHCPVRFFGTPPPPRANPIGNSPGHRLYKCGDGKWLFLGCLLPHFYRKALSVLELSDIAAAEAATAIQEKLLGAPREHWLSFFRSHDVPVGSVENREDWLKSDVIATNDLRAVVADSALGPVEMPGVPVKLRSMPGSVRHLLAEASADRLSAFVADPRRQEAQTQGVTGKPLAGVRVLDLGTLIAGPHAATILANFGADVVKIETADGDFLRPTPGLFINYNRGKRGLGLDLKTPEGRGLFLYMAERADIVIDNFRPGVRERLGIDYAALRAVNPQIISCSANTYGSKGPDARLPGFDSVLQARSGLMAAQGGEGGEPVYHTIPVNDVATAALTGFAVLAALYARAADGGGQDIETSLAGSSTAFQLGEMVSFAGRPPNPPGGRDCLGFSAVDRYYCCKDGWLTLAVTAKEQFGALARALDLEDRHQKDAAPLAAPRDGALADAIAAALSVRTLDEAISLLSSVSVPVAPVLRDEDAHGDVFLEQNVYYRRHTDPKLGELIASHGFASFDGAACAFERLPPALGEHSVEILSEYGIPAERISTFSKERVIFSAPAGAKIGSR